MEFTCQRNLEEGRAFIPKLHIPCARTRRGVSRGIPSNSGPTFRTERTLQMVAGRGASYEFTRTYTKFQAASPLCFFFFCSFFCFLAVGLTNPLILRAPPRYKYVQTKTTAKLKMM